MGRHEPGNWFKDLKRVGREHTGFASAMEGCRTKCPVFTRTKRWYRLQLSSKRRDKFYYFSSASFKENPKTVVSPVTI
jgi:hypothetical protein